MKKRLYAIAISIILVFICTSCADNSIKTSTDQFGNTVYEMKENKSVILREIPYELQYNDKTVTLENVNIYENAVDFEYNAFAVIQLDVSALTEEEIHWLNKNDLEIDGYLVHEKNEYDFTPMTYLGSLYLTDKQKLIYVMLSPTSKNNRYSFIDAEFIIKLSATQEETYEFVNDKGESRELHKKIDISYSATANGDIPSPETIEQPLYDYIAKWLYE